MTLYQRLVARGAEQHGLITVADALEVGGTREAVVMLSQRGTLERLAYGIYRIPELSSDPLQQYQEALLRFPRGVLSHDTALDLHDLCDINPTSLHLSLPPGRVRKEVPGWLTLHRRLLDERDVTWHEGLAIVTPGRAIIDGIESNVGQRFVDEALDAARRRNVLSARERQAIEKAMLTQRLEQLTTASE